MHEREGVLRGVHPPGLQIYVDDEIYTVKPGLMDQVLAYWPLGTYLRVAYHPQTRLALALIGREYRARIPLQKKAAPAKKGSDHDHTTGLSTPKE